jgi:putative glycosyltransferase (TIGR04372 family)
VRGKYQQSINLRKEILSKLYESQGVLYEGYNPPGISLGYVGPIGHQAILGTHIAAQKLGILEPRKAILPIYRHQVDRPIIRSLQNDLNFLQYTDGASWGELPNNWHIFERLQLIRTRNDFIDLYELIEEVFQNIDVSDDKPLMHFPEDYVTQSQAKLEALGLPRDAWFVALHVRNAGSGPARRNQPIDTYFPAIKEIIDLGGWVIRVGDKSMDKFPNFNQFIDLAVSNQDNSFLHPYVLASGKFFIGTSSGPASIPPLFGIPTLITNATSIGRNVLSSSKNSIYIPKLTVKSNGIALSYSETLSSCDGYGELEISELREQDLSLQCNSAEDILLGVREILDRINGTFVDDNFSGETLREIRSRFLFTSKGDIAQSFIANNKEWLN